MTSRERVLLAVNHQEAQRFPRKHDQENRDASPFSEHVQRSSDKPVQQGDKARRADERGVSKDYYAQ